MTDTCLSVFVLLLLVLPRPCLAADEPVSQLSYQAAYMREATDGAWSITITGSVPSLPGCFIILHDAAGKQLVRRVLPHGDYPADRPLRLNIPADGVTGDYRLVIIGFENDLMSINLPMSDLPYEVYGGKHFVSTAQSRFYFQSPPDVTSISMASYVGSLRVMEGDRELLDTQRDGEKDRYDWKADLPVKAGVTYRIEPYACRYFRAADGLYLTTDPARWFVPDPELEAIKWWQLPAP